MAYRTETARDEVFSGSSITDAFKGIFRMGGGWGNVSGPGLLCVFYGPRLRPSLWAKARLWCDGTDSH